MKKILYIVPHLSTGGMPQYLYKLIDEMKTTHKIYVVEWEDVTGGVLVVTKNKIKKLLDSKCLITLSKNKEEIFEYIKEIKPNVIHFQETPESFIPYHILQNLYRENRKYNIVVTTHSSLTMFNSLTFLGDHFVLVSEWSYNRCKEQLPDMSCSIWEYPTTTEKYDKKIYKEKMGFDPNYIHVLNVGLFTSNKNQGELIEIAKLCKGDKIKFHFVGNQAINFKEYWEPLMLNFPENCVWHGEKENVDDYYRASDVFYFPSKFELNPLVVKEALSYNLPVFLRKLHTYGDTYDNKVIYITGIPEKDKETLYQHVFSIYKQENFKKKGITSILSYSDTEYRKKLLDECVDNIKTPIILTTHYPVSEKIQNKCDWFIFEKENPLLYKEEYEKYGIVYNYFNRNSNGERIEIPFEYEHSYAVYTLIRNSIRLAKQNGYDYIHVINYDYKVSPSLLALHENLLNTSDIIFYKYETEYDSSYSTGFFTGKISSLLPFFEKWETKEEFYQKGNYTMFENRVYGFFKESSFNITELSFDDLKKEAECNKEGVLQFSKK